MTSSQRPVALVTGASSGIGRAMLPLLAARGHDLVLVARRGDALRDLKTQLESAHGVTVHVVSADLSLHEAPGEVHAYTTQHGLHVSVLVNNAGAGWVSPLHEAPLERLLQVVDLNVRALVHLTRLYLPGMVERRAGRIMQVGSVAAFLPGPRAATYYASKAFVMMHAVALAHELRGTGVTVTCLSPGPVETEFQVSSGVTNKLAAGAAGLSAEAVARAGVEGMFAGRLHVLPGVTTRLTAALSNIVPHAISARAVEALQKRRTQPNG